MSACTIMIFLTRKPLGPKSEFKFHQTFLAKWRYSYFAQSSDSSAYSTCKIRRY